MYLNNIGNDIDALEMCMNILYELMLHICTFPMYLNNIGKDIGNIYEFFRCSTEKANHMNIV